MLESLEIRITEPIENYKYEWISAVAHYAVDPDAPANARIADLGLAPRDHDGNVRFSGDVVLLRPADGTNGRAILSVPNRGMVRLPYSGSGIGPTGVRTAPSPGDGFLLDRGWTIALPGWQWDVPRDTGFAGLDAPVADVGPGWLRSDFRVDAPSQEWPIGDMMPSLGGAPAFAFTSYPASRLDDPEAALRVRSAHMGPSRLIPRSQWRFTSATSIALDGGFQPFHWYELIYRSSFAPVAGRACSRCATSARTCAATTTSSSPAECRRRAGYSANSSSRDSTSTSRATRSSTGYCPRSPVPAAANSTAATPSLACSTP